jgi:hypothetical protein
VLDGAILDLVFLCCPFFLFLDIVVGVLPVSASLSSKL